MQVGVQSWCFREFKKTEDVIARIKQCGLAAVELSGVHADFSNEASFRGVIDAYREAGIDIVSIGVQGFANEPQREDLFGRFVKQAGAKFMSVDFNLARAPECYRAAERLADKYGVRLAIHNHGRRHALGSEWMLKQVFQQTSPRIGLCLDTAWALDAGLDPVAAVETFGDRMYGLHIKDFVFDRAGKPEDVVVGTGNLDLVKLAAALKRVSFQGFAVLEYEGDVRNPVPAVTRCVEAIRAVWP